MKICKGSPDIPGHIIRKDGIHADPAKMAEVLQIKYPQNIVELQPFMGMVNRRGKFSPNLAQVTHECVTVLVEWAGHTGTGDKCW